MDVVSDIKSLIAEAIDQLWPDVEIPTIEVNVPPKSEYGDYTSPISLPLAKQLGATPMEIATQIEDHLSPKGVIGKITISHPGFINFFINYEELARSVLESSWEFATDYKGKISVEHTSVNPNKAAHVGHLRNATLGDTVARILRALGNEVEVQNYIDDLGVQVADSVVAYEQFGDPADDTPIDEWFWEIYAKINALYETRPDLQERRNQVLAEMEKGESQTAKQIVEWIVTKHRETFQKFGIRYDLEVHEHDIVHNHLWDQLFEKLKSANLIHQPSDGPHAGAWIVEFGKGEREDKILVRSNGIVTYTGKDLAYALWKFGQGPEMPEYKGRLKPVDQHVNVIDERQSYPQAVIKQVMRDLGYESEANNYLHLGYGVVKLSEKALIALGGRTTEQKASYSMSGRAGVGVMVNQLLAAAHTKAQERIGNETADAEVANGLAVGSIRYYLLKTRPEREIVFDFDDALRSDGNTGVYLQYAYARANNIINKIGEISPAAVPTQLNESEQGLIKIMAEANQAIAQTVRELDPSILCDYAYHLSSSFAKFYETSPVASAEGEIRNFRANLVVSYKNLLGRVLGLLGIPVLNKI